MKFFFRLIYCLLFSAALMSAQSGNVFGQNANQKQASVEVKPLTIDAASPQQHALILLDQLIGQTNRFEGSDKSVKTALFQAEAADVLWDYDLPRAHSLFETAIKTAGAQLPTVTDARPLSSYATQPYSALCKEIVDLALARDAAFAERLVSLALIPLQASESKNAAPAMAFYSEQATLYCQIARRIAASDPQHAAELIRLSFNSYYSFDQIRALNALRRYAPALADEIFQNALITIRNKPTSISNKVGILAAYVFPEIQNEAGLAVRDTRDANMQPVVSPTLIKIFLEFVYGSFTPQPVMAQTAENNQFGLAAFDKHTMEELIPRFERYLPDKADVFRARVAEVVKHIKESGREDMSDRESDLWRETFRSNVQDWIKKAETAKTQKERDSYYSEAAGLLTLRDGDFEQALALLDKVSDGERGKAYQIQDIRKRQTQKAIETGDAEKAYHYSQNIQDADSRAGYLTDIARLYAKSGQAERAKAVLAEARQSIVTSQDNAYSILDRATVAVEISPSFGFQVMKEAIEAINALPSPASGAGYGVSGIIYPYRHDFDENLGVLARTDFDHALELAKSIQAKDVSLQARFAICKGILLKAESASSRR